MSRLIPKNLSTIFKLWIYPTRLFLVSPFTFSAKNEIEISRPWRIISSIILLISISVILYTNTIHFFPDDIRNPFQILGYSRLSLHTIVVTIRIIETVIRTKAMATIGNKILKIDSLLTLNRKKRIYCFFYLISAIILITASVLVRFTPIFSWIRNKEFHILPLKLSTNVTEIFLVVMDINLMNFIFLIGFYFDRFHTELEKLKNMKDAKFFQTFEILYYRNQ